METRTIKILNTGEKVKIILNISWDIRQFIRISSEVLFGVVEERVGTRETLKNSTIGLVYVFQKTKNGVYDYVGHMEIKPVKTQIKLEFTKNPMQLKFFGGFGTGSMGKQREQLKLMFEEQGDSKWIEIIPLTFKYVFSVE